MHARRPGRCRTDERRHRRLFLRRRRAGLWCDVDGRLSGPAQASPYGFDRDGRLFVYPARRSCCRGDCGRQVFGRARHARRKATNQLRRRAAWWWRLCGGPGSCLRTAVWRHHAQSIRNVRHAPHARIRHDERAARLDQGRSVASRPIQRTRVSERGRHGRGCSRFTDDRDTPAPPRLLRHHRRWRRVDCDQSRRCQEAEPSKGENHRSGRSAEGHVWRQGRPHLFGSRLERAKGIR